MTDRLLGGITPVPDIPENPAQFPGIGGRDPVMPVKIELGQTGEINTESLLRREAFQKLRV